MGTHWSRGWIYFWILLFENPVKKYTDFDCAVGAARRQEDFMPDPKKMRLLRRTVITPDCRK